jgi:hypothetical protein
MEQHKKMVSFWLTPREKERLKKDAHGHEMGVSEYLRWLIDKQSKEDGNGNT